MVDLKPTAEATGFSSPALSRSLLRQAIRASIRTPEPECVPNLIEQASLDANAATRVKTMAGDLAQKVRAAGPSRGIAGVVHEYSLSSEEGVALMCLAEALLRIPDDAMRDALIRDKISHGDWRAHLGPERTLFVNAATWGLMVTGRIANTMRDDGLARGLGRLIARGGEPIVRAGIDIAMRLMGETFVAGQTIEEALRNARRLERRGFAYSYDMLGEAATTAEDAARYRKAYEGAIDAIGAQTAGRGPIAEAGISIKLSALHPRYRRSQIERVTAELLPTLEALALRARRYDIGLNIDAEEADRLDISLDLLEALCFAPALKGWNGLGFVVQAYGKRCPQVIDWLVDLARRSNHRLMIRLVKGAYWDSEIKVAQFEGLNGYPVYTRKVYTDVSYLACARKLLAARDVVFPQFATHNAQTVASIIEMAGPAFQAGSYEFQCLRGMGEVLYNHVVGTDNLNRPCRIYAPVGTHGTLLPYLVRRLLENGANSSFVNRVSDDAVPIDELVADPAQVAAAIQPPGAPHPKIPLPSSLLGTRLNSAGIDLADENSLTSLSETVSESTRRWSAVPVLAAGVSAGTPLTLCNPANSADIVGTAEFASIDQVSMAFVGATPNWAPLSERTALLRRGADRLQSRLPEFVGLMMREAGKTAANGIAEVREAIDFLRYYTDQAGLLPERSRPLGTIVCISPWNFPLAIFTGQIAAALAAGNAVLAKPAEETPLTAAAMVGLLHDVGVPRGALQFLPGAGDIGAALCAHASVDGVVFTGSTEVARTIQRKLAERGDIPLIAETGGINAMIVDSSALTEQVVNDVLSSAFDSAGQRCSALRLLCIQDDVADRIIQMLKGAMTELRIGNPAELRTDIGPVITAEAKDRINLHIEAMRSAGHPVTQARLAANTGTFVPPTIVEIDRIDQLTREVFGPVLHVVRYAREDLDRTIDAVNALGFGLTFGLHTRIDETIDHVSARISAGNIYVNRNMIGAVVGVQPFGGQGLSGTGPKAGGPLYVRRLVKERASDNEYDDVLPGPVGETNLYRTVPRGEILLVPRSREGLSRLLDVVVATRNRAAIETSVLGESIAFELAPAARLVDGLDEARGVAGVLVEGDRAQVAEIARVVASWLGPIVPVQGVDAINRDMLVHEVAVSINTAAAGGNASLMAMGETG